MRWDIKKEKGAYVSVQDHVLKSLIRNGRIKKGEVTVWRSGLSSFRPPEDLEELRPYFKQKKPKLNAEAVTPTGPQVPRKIQNILIIDDEQDLANFFAKFLSPTYHAEVASSGKEAMQKLASYHPDLILLDVALPDCSGVALIPKIQMICPKVYIVMISGYGTDEMKEQAQELGVSQFIDKPFSLKTILKIIGKISNSNGAVPQNARIQSR